LLAIFLSLGLVQLLVLVAGVILAILAIAAGLFI
jgi:hypothetical protein